MRTKLPGISLAVGLGLTAIFLSALTPSFLNSYLLALLVGMILAPSVNKVPQLDTGISLSSAKMLEWSVVLLAFSIDYKAIGAIGATDFAIIIIVVLVVLVATYYLSKVLSCPGKTGWLVGFGTAICGSSAIAALAPKIKANKEDVAISLASVNLLGSLAMVLLPFVFEFYPLLEKEMAFLIGASLHSVGNVAGAGFSVSEEVGQLALVYKMARVALLSPALLFMVWLDSRKSNEQKFRFQLPWYLIVFIAVSIFVSFFPLPAFLLKGSETIGKIILTIAMAAIGLKVDVFRLLKAGQRGLVFALVVFVLQIGLLWLLNG
ncbi:MAG: putative sulfate exporter family transporter [Crocinitomicaceae bacterium]|nr:putative sulfate exporter family transporter [Crocinitomicaceae bacterium]